MLQFRWTNFFDDKNKKEIKKIYLTSFPKTERYPFWLLRRCASSKNVEFYSIYDDSLIIGVVYLLNHKDITYLLYLAVKEQYRNQGYGSKILKDLLIKKSKNKIILSIERSNYNELAFRRKMFYLKNGFYSTNQFLKDGVVEYELLCSNQDFDVNATVLRNLYQQMTNHLKYRKIMNDIYHIEQVNFIDS